MLNRFSARGLSPLFDIEPALPAALSSWQFHVITVFYSAAPRFFAASISSVAQRAPGWGAESFGGAGYGEYGDDAPGVVKNGGRKG